MRILTEWIRATQLIEYMEAFPPEERRRMFYFLVLTNHKESNLWAMIMKISGLLRKEEACLRISKALMTKAG